MEKWMVSARKADFNRIARMCSVSPVLARIMVNRGLKEDEEFQKYLYGDLSCLHDPEDMKDMKAGVDCIVHSIRENQSICIASDFDVDGVFAGYILWRGILLCGGRAYVDVPDRIQEGYGLNERIVREAYAKGAGCILTCDNGIAAMEPVLMAKAMGLTVVITDHHEPVYDIMHDDEGKESRRYRFPEADAVIDPKQPDCAYPFKGLCGAGVAYKFVQMLFEKFHIDEKELYKLLPFAAIATVADVMDLTDENRIIVKYGLHELAHTDHPGLLALIFHAGLNKNYISAYHVGFVIGPCFNAAGRLDTAQMAIRLLQTEDAGEAQCLASDLVELNQSRKEMTILGTKQAEELIESKGII